MKVRTTSHRRLLAVAVSVATAAAIATIAPTASAAPRAHILSAPPTWTSQARSLGSVAPKTTVQFGVLLGLREVLGAQARLKAISTPGSPTYGQWLSDNQFRAAYAPTAQTVSSVQGWLKARGFAIRKTLTSGTYIEVSGSAALVNKTFATSLKTFLYDGQTVHANATALSLPANTPSTVVSAVSAVVGLDQAAALKKPADPLPGPPSGTRYGVTTQPCSSYFGEKTATTKPSANKVKQPYAVCGYTPTQLQTAYSENVLLKAGVTGKGVRVAVTDAYASPTIAADLAKYSKHYGLPQLTKGQLTQIVPSSGYFATDFCAAQGWYGEETLDLEAVHAMAPGASLVYAAAPDCYELADTWAETIDSHVADIVTNSWTDNTDDINVLGQSSVDFFNQFSLEAALTGITVLFSSGDQGDLTGGKTNLDQKSVSFPSDVPYVTGVGGTTLAVDKNGRRSAEYGWQTAYSQLSGTGKSWAPSGFDSGGGGGTSVLYTQPFYQRGVVPRTMSEYFTRTPARTVPDIAMDADPNTGLVVGQTQQFPNGTYYDEYRIGGTSLAAPLMAGVLAVTSQLAHHTLGFVNPLLYRLSGSGSVYDVVAPKTPVYQVRTDFTNLLDRTSGFTYRLESVDVRTTIQSSHGYDTETGVGTPNLLFYAASAILAQRGTGGGYS